MSNSDVRSVNVNSWGTGDNDCYWNIAKTQLEQTQGSATSAEIQALVTELKKLNNAEDDLVCVNDEIIIPTRYAVEEVQENISAKTEELTTVQEEVATAQGNLETATGKVSSTLSTYNSYLSSYDAAVANAADDGSDDTEILNLYAQVEDAKSAYLAALEEQQAAQTALEEKQQELTDVQTELADYQTQVDDLMSELESAEEDYSEEMESLEAQRSELETQIAEAETDLQNAQAQQDAATAQQDAATSIGVTTDDDGNLTLDSELTADDLQAAATASEEAATVGSTKEVSSADISTDEDGNTVKTVTYADGTTAEYSQNENGEWELESGTIYNEDESSDEDIDEGSIEYVDSIAANLRTDYDSENIEYTENEDGTITGTYTNTTSESWGTSETTTVITYDPETGVTTAKTYNTSDGEEYEEGDETSIVTYDSNSHTKTTETYYTSVSDGETTEEVLTSEEVYEDDTFSEESLLRKTIEGDDYTYVATYEEGEETGSYKVKYSDDEKSEVSEITIKDANGTSVTLDEDAIEQLADESGVSSSTISEMIEDIRNGKSASYVFSSDAGQAIIAAMEEQDDVTLSISESDTDELQGIADSMIENPDGAIEYIESYIEAGDYDSLITLAQMCADNEEGSTLLGSFMYNSEVCNEIVAALQQAYNEGDEDRQKEVAQLLADSLQESLFREANNYTNYGDGTAYYTADEAIRAIFGTDDDGNYLVSDELMTYIKEIYNYGGETEKDLEAALDSKDLDGYADRIQELGIYEDSDMAAEYVSDIQANYMWGNETTKLKEYFNYYDEQDDYDDVSEKIQEMSSQYYTDGEASRCGVEDVLADVVTSNLSQKDAQEIIAKLYSKYNSSDNIVDAIRDMRSSKDQETYMPLLAEIYAIAYNEE